MVYDELLWEQAYRDITIERLIVPRGFENGSLPFSSDSTLTQDVLTANENHVYRHSW